jgi:anaerobic glycerol-3-phosphate dehydrogenase
MFDVLIIGGGVSGISCSLYFETGKKKAFVTENPIPEKQSL